MSYLAENYESHKEEILAKSRKSKNDEGMQNARLDGITLGFIISFAVIEIPMFIISIITGQYIVVAALCALNGIGSLGRNIPMYRFTGKKRYLVWGIFFGILGIIMFVFFILYALHKF